MTIAAWPPSLVNSFRRVPLVPTSEPIPLPAAPDTAKMNANPAAQPASAGHCRRHASENGPRSSEVAAGRPGRSAIRPAPWSRRSASTKASQAPAANTASGSASTHQRSPAKGRRVSVQPSGRTQVSHAGPPAPAESPTARARNDAPSTPNTRPRAARAPDVSWAATALIPVKASPQVPMASASAAEPVKGSPMSGSSTHSSTVSTTLAAVATASADISGAWRPTRAEPISSRRPASSSALVCLMTMKTDMSAANSAPQTPYRHAVSAPTDVPFSRP